MEKECKISKYNISDYTHGNVRTKYSSNFLLGNADKTSVKIKKKTQYIKNETNTGVL